jgi:RNA polymerase sigma factor (TIGR02999 family)
MTDLTVIFERIKNGEGHTFDELLPIVYDELKQLARGQMAKESPGQTLQTTALVHEAYLRLVGGDQNWDGRGHFFTAAAEAMRRILVERARGKQTLKRGGQQKRRELGPDLASAGPDPEEVVLVNDLLDALAAERPEVAEIFKLHYFAGFNLSEAGQAIGISSSTAHRHWVYARAWLYEEMKKGD